MNSTIAQWAVKWRVPHQALAELEAHFGITPPPPLLKVEHSEAYVQSLVRLEAARKGVKLFRNNVGVLTNQETGQPVRYGLANDSKALNMRVKSGDLIGWRPVLIGPAHIGHVIAQFVSRECKRPDWTYTNTEHEEAQRRWAEAVAADGGDACFVTGEGTL